MAYQDFTLEKVVYDFSLELLTAQLFVDVQSLPLNPHLEFIVAKGLEIALPAGSEKVRNELIVMPLLLALQDRNPDLLRIHSGANLKVDRSKGLVGECDFILSWSKIQAFVETPIFAIVEAKKQDIEAGLGQCAAQMVGAQLLNQRHGKIIPAIFGCVTTGAEWRFLKLVEEQLTLDSQLYAIRNPPEILGVLQAIVDVYRR
jgi:hypothetical protein